MARPIAFGLRMRNTPRYQTWRNGKAPGNVAMWYYWWAQWACEFLDIRLGSVSMFSLYVSCSRRADASAKRQDSRDDFRPLDSDEVKNNIWELLMWTAAANNQSIEKQEQAYRQLGKLFIEQPQQVAVAVENSLGLERAVAA